MASNKSLPPYNRSLAGTLLAAREAVMAPIRPMLRDAEVTEQQWRVLRVLGNMGPMEPTALAEAALLFPPSVARILKELLDRDLVEREAHGRDKRRAIVSLTPGGEALIRKTASHTLKLYRTYHERFGEERLDRLIAELRALIDSIAPLAETEQQPARKAVSRRVGGERPAVASRRTAASTAKRSIPA